MQGPCLDRKSLGGPPSATLILHMPAVLLSQLPNLWPMWSVHLILHPLTWKSLPPPPESLQLLPIQWKRQLWAASPTPRNAAPGGQSGCLWGPSKGLTHWDGVTQVIRLKRRASPLPLNIKHLLTQSRGMSHKVLGWTLEWFVLLRYGHWLQTTEKQAQSEPWMGGSHSVQGMGLRRVMTAFGGLARQHQVKPCLLSRICLNQMGRHKCDQGQVLALSLTSCAPWAMDDIFFLDNQHPFLILTVCQSSFEKILLPLA